jgi:hypothetical protein
MDGGIVDYPIIVVPNQGIVQIKSVNKKAGGYQKNYQR